MIDRSTIRFGVFELDRESGELRRNGSKIHLQEQPLQILVSLLERPGKVVTRDELQKKLWPSDTFIDFDHGLNAAIKRLRDALGESADNPIFIETLARRGYRFIAPIVQDAGSQSEASQTAAAPSSSVPVVPPSFAAVKIAEAHTTVSRGKLWKITSTVAAFVIALAGIVVWFARPPLQIKVLNATQITHDGVPKQEIILTDGSRLYFIETNGARTFLAQASVAGGETSVIATPFSNVAVTDISPDHSQILARNFIGTDPEARFWTLPLAAGNPRPLSDIIGHSGVWSRDGIQFAFARGSDIYLADADGSNPRKLITVSGAADWIRFSPDGSRLRFTRALQGDSPSIWEVRIDGRDPHRVISDLDSPVSECCGAWSVNGRYYFFLRNASGRLFRNVSGRRDDIWVLRESAAFLGRLPSAPFQLTSGPMSLGPPLPGHDGKTLFAEGLLSRGELVRYESSSRQFKVFLSGISAGELDFSRDGKSVVYVSYPERTLWRSRIDGSEARQLTHTPVAAFLPRWSPDGTQIVYVDLQAGRSWRVFLISAQGGTPQDLLAGKEGTVADPTWSPDGKQICFGRSPYSAAGTKKIQVLDLSSKQISTIPASDNLYSPRWSPDGQHLSALSADSTRLLLYDFKTRKWTDWLNEPGAIGFPTWSRDGEYIYYDNTSTEKPAFLRAKVGRARPERLIELGDIHRYGKYAWAWSGLAPDDSALLVRDVSTDEIYALDLDLR